MKEITLIARANLRKAQGQTATIAVLVLLASMMMNLWLMLATDYKQNFDRCYDRLNDGHITITAYCRDEGFTSRVSELIKSRDDVTETCVTEVYGWVGSFAYNGGETSSNFVFLEKDTAIARSVGRFEIVEEGGGESGIYIPILYGSDYAIGEEIELTIGNEKRRYPVCGYLNSASLGSHNCGMTAFLLTEDKYAELSSVGALPASTLVSVRLSDRDQAETVLTEIRNAIAEEFPGSILLSNSYTANASARYISQTICAAILSAMAFLILLIAAVVIASNVMHCIHEEMKNLGALKAVGYRSRQLIAALVTRFAAVVLPTAAVGAALSYTIFPALNEMMIAQTGIPYEPRFLPFPFFTTLIFMTGSVAATVFLSARRIRKIELITALRQGLETHTFRKNPLPLDRGKSPLDLALALKTVLSEKKRSATVGVTVLVLSLILVFSGVMFENFIVDRQRFIDLVMGETCDSCINISPAAEDRLVAALADDGRVKRLYQYTSEYVTHVGGLELIANICDDCAKLNNLGLIFEGRAPRYDNEIAVAIKYARDNALAVGDEISLTTGTAEEKFLISGFTQLSNNLGRDCLITREGFERIGELTNCSYYLNVADGTDVDAFNEEIAASFPGEVNAVLNMTSAIEGASRVYISLVTVIVIAVLIISGLIVMFVLHLLVRTALASKKRDYGILKALGFTTGRLVIQTALSFMPSVVLSTAVGIALGAVVINPLLALFLGGIGIVKCTFAVPLGFNIAAGIGLILFAFAAACLMSLRVRRITPRELLSGE
ncbi:MAG: ABC transporter permease [Bacteroides sp.]|nr:ABC transporter permease [Eubacterium sp.]MCM1419205.1 ABC transporter permease [Roseburia sp.]MCM1463028.1 ABC transporter permease [Bacteroides sp.]